VKSPFKVEDASNSGEYPFFTSGEKVLTHDKYLVDGENIFLATGGYATVKYYNGKASYSTDTWSLKVKDVSTKFVYYQILVRLRYIDEVLFRGSGLRHLQKQEFLDLEIHIPPLPIQQKIVQILDTIQEAIDIQDKIIEKTKELKKSLMAELFKYGGPSFRKGRKLKKTEIGEIPENWEVVRLGEVFKIVAGGDISKLNFSPKKTDKFIYPIYSNTIVNNGLYGFADTYQFEGNCITVTARGTIGYAIPRFEKFNAIIRLLVLIPKINLNIIYVSEFINEKIRVAFENTSIPQLTVPRFSIFKIPLPPLPEQQEIAEILQTVDQKIDIERRKKELYEELFKTVLNKIMNQEIDVESVDF
jgi:type I restriction enzyme S subunit